MRKFTLLFAAFLVSLSVWAQERTVTGTVTAGEDGSVIPGANVVLKGTSTGVATDANGNYTITVPGPDAVLTFTFIGRLSKDVTVGDQTQINVALGNSDKELDEVVVTANAIERRKRELGYATTEFNNQDVTQGRDRSVLNSMQGKVAGVNITSSAGSPGASTRVVIRGNKSLTNNNQALFVVDGIPIDNSNILTNAPGDASNPNLNNQVDAGNRANDINPEDIESITVLKGPAAAALYGSRASNGAIIITTKSGKGAAGRGRKMEVNYTASYTFEDILRLPEFQNSYGQGGQFVPDYRENFSWGPKFDGKVRPWGKEVNGQRKVKPYVGLPDNVKEFFDIGRTFQQNVSLGGGNEKSNYFTSFGMLDQKGVIPSTGFKRYNFKVNGGTQLNNQLYASANLTYTKSVGDLSVQGQRNSIYDQVVQTPRDISLLELSNLNDPFNNLNNFYSPYTINPYYFIKNDSYRSDVDRLLGNLQFGYKPLEWLDITYRIGTDVYTDRREQINSRRDVDPNSENSQFDAPYPGFYSVSNYTVQNITSDLIVTVNKQINEDFGFRFIAGHNVFALRTTEAQSFISDLVIPGFYNLSNGGTPASAFNRRLQRRLYGVYGDLTLSFRDYLFVGLTGRYDWVSTLRRGNNSIFYPAANVSFLFSEAFQIPKNIISMGKLRLNAASVGSGGELPYLLNTVYLKGDIDDGFQNTNLTFPLNGVPGFEVGNRIGNPDLKLERSNSYELGLDMNFLDNRFGFELSYYQNVNVDLITSIPLSPSTGYTSFTTNVGQITNKGIEALVRATPVKVGGFEWNISVNYTQNRNNVDELFEGVSQIPIGNTLSSATLVAQVNQPYGSFLVNAERLDPQGRVIVDDNGLPILDPQARLVGNIQPLWQGGLTNTFSYKGIFLSLTFDHRQGGTLYSRTKDVQEFVGTSPNTLYNDRQPFIVPNSVIENEDGSFTPNTTRFANAQDYWTDQSITSRNLLPATFTKLREISLSYSLPKAVLDRTPFGNVIVGISGRNLWLRTPKENTFVDPEVSSNGSSDNAQGYDFTAIPSLKSFGGNIRITF